MRVTSYETGSLTFPQGLKGIGTRRKSEPREGRRTLLLVEDNEDTCDILRMWLESDGYEVVTAGDGWEAVQSVLHNRYDAILLDLSLPTMDGISALRLIRSHEHLRSVPVVAITAYDLAYTRAEAMEAMCDEYMVKPLDLGRLEAVITRVLGRAEA